MGLEEENLTVSISEHAACFDSHVATVVLSCLND